MASDSYAQNTANKIKTFHENLIQLETNTNAKKNNKHIDTIQSSCHIVN